MRPVVVAAVLFLVVLISMSDSASGQHHTDWFAIPWIKLCKKVPDVRCTNGWRRLDQHRCVKVFSVTKTFDNAQRHCVQLKGNLVAILSKSDTNVVLCETIKTFNTQKLHWIGAQKRQKRFQWLAGYRLLKYRSWEFYQPDNWGGHENCVEANFKYMGLWNDQKCWKKRPFVCQKRM